MRIKHYYKTKNVVVNTNTNTNKKTNKYYILKYNI